MDISSSLKSLDIATASNKPMQFSFVELMRYTSNLRTEIGSGGFGQVYKGEFSNGVKIAVKMMMTNTLFETFESEVNTMFKTSHQHVLKLYGFCFYSNIQAIVFEYMENGSLDKILYDNHLNMKWKRLYDIAIKTAEGLAYLHNGCEQQIIHQDIKPANVLLDLGLSPKIADFGVAKLMDRNLTHFTMSGFGGTMGYAAPETWFPYSKVTYKCDVYSFGMMLFEVLGRKRNSQRTKWLPKECWKKFENGNLDDIIISCGIQQKDKEKATILSMVALWCVQYIPEMRPSMRDVVMMLRNQKLVESPPDPFSPWKHTQTLNSMPSTSAQPYEEVILPLNPRSPGREDNAAPLVVSDPDSEKLQKKFYQGVSESMLESFEHRCPPGGNCSVVLYTTTLETAGTAFQECNNVRSILNSHGILMFERDVHRAPDYEEELRQLTRVPLVFVDGRFIGGADEVMRLDHQGTLKILLNGIPKI